MDDNDKPAGPPKKGQKAGSPDSSLQQTLRPERFVFTMDANTGEIIQIEAIDATGARHELSRDEKASLAKDNGRIRLEEILEQAFEAGIACVLGGADEQEEMKEAKEDADLRRILLKPLIDESSAGRLMRRDLLDRAIVETLIHHSLKSGSQRRKGNPPREPDPNHAAPKGS